MVTLHADLCEGADRQQTLAAIVERLRLRFGVEHATVQLEEGECADFSDPENCHELDDYKGVPAEPDGARDSRRGGSMR